MEGKGRREERGREAEASKVVKLTCFIFAINVRNNLCCRRRLQVSKCGDGLVDAENGEQCDDGNADIHDDCIGQLSHLGGPTSADQPPAVRDFLNCTNT